VYWTFFPGIELAKEKLAVGIVDTVSAMPYDARFVLCRQHWRFKFLLPPAKRARYIMQKLPLVSVVTPFYNEGEGVKNFYDAICEVFRSIHDVKFEVICVDDGSRDDTLKQLVDLTHHDSRFRVIELSRNFGKEAALTAGIDAAKGNAVIPIDSDLQDPPELIPTLICEWRNGADVVLARRTDRTSDSFFKRKTAEIFYQVHNRLSPIKIPPNVGDYRLMDRAAVDALKLLPEHQRFMKGLFAWIGFKTSTVDYVRNARTAGTTKFSGWKLWNFALEGITSFSAAPLKIWTYVGGVGALITISYALFIILRTIIKGVDIPGYASLLVAVLFFGSLQLISVGMMGEYLGRIYMEAKRRPIYLVRRHYGIDNEP
jgi:glycosyltransferase involved in cell wall biosynthesis